MGDNWWESPVATGSIRLRPGNPGRLQLEFWVPDGGEPVHIDAVMLVAGDEEIQVGSDLEIVGQATPGFGLTVPAPIGNGDLYRLALVIAGHRYDGENVWANEDPVGDGDW